MRNEDKNRRKVISGEEGKKVMGDKIEGEREKKEGWKAVFWNVAKLKIKMGIFGKG